MSINNNYVIFISDSSFILRTTSGSKAWDGSIIDYNSGNQWIGSRIFSIDESGRYVIRLKGYSNTYLSGGWYGNNSWVLSHSNNSDTNPIICEGYIETLLDYSSPRINPVMYYGCRGLFKNNTLLKTTLSIRYPVSSYPAFFFYEMYYGCTALESSTIQLKGNVLQSNACKNMFKGCTSLTSSPKIEINNIYDSACEGMFEGCRSLATAGDITATMLRDSACKEMFKGCTSLTSPPLFYPTSLSKSCCDSMFYGCSKLNSIMLLPATNLPEYCYYFMFYNTKIRISSGSNYSYRYRIPFSKNASLYYGNSVFNMFVKTHSYDSFTPNLNTNYFTNANLINPAFQISFYNNSQERDTADATVITQHIGDYLILPDPPQRIGYTFSYWSTSTSGGDVYTENTQLIDEIDFLYAQWSANQYNVAFDSQGADTSGTTSIVATYDQKLSSIQVPERHGYLFCGYFSDIDGSGLQYYTFEGNSNYIWEQTADITLYAFWIKKSEVNEEPEYVEGVYDKYTRVAAYQNYKESSKYNNTDFIGYIDKDVEYYLNK